MNDHGGGPSAVALRFVDRINHADVAGLEALMAEDHVLRVFDEPPQRGRPAVAEGWRGYARAFPAYTIYSHRVAVRGNQVAILGHTTGSHLGLPDEEETKLTLIFLVDVEGERVASWTLVEDTPDNRRAFALDSAGPDP
jgi:ketosteroid isomerase-like protein